MTDCAIDVVRAGLHTTLQDGGRWGLQHLGVPVGGALDLAALSRANALVGNADHEVALEATLGGCRFRAAGDAVVAVTGARVALTIDGAEAALDTALSLPDGATLVLGAARSGARAYVAVRGGLDVPLVLGSRSSWPLAARRGALVDGERLRVGTRTIGPPRPETWPSPLPSRLLRILRAPDAEAGGDVLSALCRAPYRVSTAATRMAYPLDGPPVSLVVPDRSSSGTVTGAIQILPSGQPLLLMAERQTTGGYPIAAVVATADLSSAAQLAPGDEVRLVPCSRAEALQALMRAPRDA